MESPGFLTLLYVMNTLPQKAGVDDLPFQNRVLGGLFVCDSFHDGENIH